MSRILAVSCRHFLLCATMFLLLAPFQSACAARFKTLFNFTQGNLTNGVFPQAGLIVDQAGNLYGTTTEGGTGSGCQGAGGCGVVFELGPNGTETVLYSFQGGGDGSAPDAGVIMDQAGDIYGTTIGGGIAGCGIYGACGTVFKLAPDGTHTVLYSFKGGGKDGGLPAAPLLVDQEGNLYGTTTAGGGAGCGGYGCGTVFKLAPDGTETLLHAFRGGSDGASLFADGLIADQTGNLYGMTNEGGSGSCGGAGCGTIFKIATDGTETILHAFEGGRRDGTAPEGSLIMDQAGNLYGTSFEGGRWAGPRCFNYGCGTIFKLAPNGTLKLLHSFRGNLDGALPTGGLVEDQAGNFYGTTLAGGHGFHCCNACGPNYNGCGTVFKLARDGTETVFRLTFADGHHPFDGLVADRSGNLYGTTTTGSGTDCGGGGCGTVFKFKP